MFNVLLIIMIFRLSNWPWLSTARKVVHRVLAMLDLHYQGLDRMTLSGGWAPGNSDDHCDQLEEDCASSSAPWPTSQ
jgi:hypothetical protein